MMAATGPSTSAAAPWPRRRLVRTNGYMAVIGGGGRSEPSRQLDNVCRTPAPGSVGARTHWPGPGRTPTHSPTVLWCTNRQPQAVSTLSGRLQQPSPPALTGHIVCSRRCSRHCPHKRPPPGGMVLPLSARAVCAALHHCGMAQKRKRLEQEEEEQQKEAPRSTDAERRQVCNAELLDACPATEARPLLLSGASSGGTSRRRMATWLVASHPPLPSTSPTSWWP